MRRVTATLFALILSGASLAMADDISPMQKHKQIDVVSLSPDKKVVVLSLVETRAWDDKGTNLVDLQEKLNTYLIYVDDGLLVRDYPQVRGKIVRFRLHSTFAPNANAVEFIDLVREKYLRPRGIEWETSAPEK